MVLEKTLEIPLDSKEIKPVNPKGNQPCQSQRKSTLNIHWKDCCWSWSSNTLATWYKELTHWKGPCCCLKIEGKRRRRWQKMRCLGSITDSMDMSLSKLWEIVKNREAWHAAVHGFAKSATTQWLSNNRWHSSKESTCQFRRHKTCSLDPCVRKIPWRRKWQPAPMFLPEKFHGQRSLAFYSPLLMLHLSSNILVW